MTRSPPEGSRLGFEVPGCRDAIRDGRHGGGEDGGGGTIRLGSRTRWPSGIAGATQSGHKHASEFYEAARADRMAHSALEMDEALACGPNRWLRALGQCSNVLSVGGF
mgnify:CR=1 FL=1